ncbi:hypothetical protein OIU77_007346 [Salix suchowensis]|uniref:DCD domain-containing protein n=1 Tax=Salix suchowensis TaxID=1278906 RepID=A0ABQ9AFT5_9ROSI|nr:hypothetical protein OIU77_007346 [Salix suchowensis]
MEFYEPNNVPGKYPEFGAIFMSNRATREECFRRKLLGLPSGQADFVKQVKSGMILFLFEFERRELHGVFQACSDGTVNIVPQAYRSSGKQFPAQEQFVVSSSEVGGLAEDARVVRSNMVENDQDVDIESRTNELVEDNGFQQPSTEHTGMFQSNPGLAEDARGNGHDGGIESRTDVPTNHNGHSFPTRRRSSDNVNSVSKYGLGQELMEDNGFQKPSTKYTDMFQSNSPQSFSKPILEETSSVSDHFQQSSAILVELQNSQYYRQSILKAIKDQFRTSPAAHHLMESHNSELSFSALDGDRLPRSNALYSTSYGDGVGASNIPYDPDVPRPGNRCSSSRGLSNSVPEFPASHSFAIHSFDQSFHPHMEPEGTSSHLNINASLSDYILLSNANQHDHLNRPDMFFPGADYPSHAARTLFMNGNTGHRRSPSSFELCNSVPQCPPHNIFPAFVNESFPSYIEPKSTSECQNLNSLLSSDSPFSHPGHHDHANRTSMLYPGAAYPENVQRNSSGIEWTREDNSACSCSLNRSSSFVSAGRYSVSSQEELDHQISQLENDEALSVSVPRLKHHENGLINLVTRENSERMFSDHQKRESVFSRLAFSSEVCKQEEHAVDSSVDEVMTILHQKKEYHLYSLRV